MTYITRHFSLSLITAAIATLSACGGGGGGGGGETNAAPTINGVAATGLAISGGNVSLKCVSGTAAAVSTASDGSYSVPSTGLTLPCVARVDYGSAQKLHTLVLNEGIANITPVTDLMLANLTKGAAATAFDNFDAATVKTYDAAKVSAAIAGVKTYLENLGVDTSRLAVDPIGIKLVAATAALPLAGDDSDRVLDQLKIKLGTKTIEAAGLELAAITAEPTPAAPPPVASSPAPTASAAQPAASAPATTPTVATQTITFTGPGAQTLGTTPAVLSATASSGLAVTLASATSSVCTVSGSTLALVAAGDCTVTASQAGNTGYSAASPVSVTFKVAAAPLKTQTITFAQPANQTIGVAAPALGATSDSGLIVGFASTTPSICTVSGTTLTLVAAGSCSVTATQTGNASYAAATAVAHSFTVAAAPVVFAGVAASGKTLYASKNCSGCHGATPGTQNILAHKGGGATAVYTALNGSINTVGSNGYSQMNAFYKTGGFMALSNQDLLDLAAYLAGSAY